MYANRPAASRGNAYLNPGALSGEKRALPDFDCANAAGDRMTAQPDSSDAPSCFAQDPPAWPPGNKSPYPHVDAANYSK
jgi:phospholipid/cholesterol/gamma-HCH transport system substrate-binding protein